VDRRVSTPNGTHLSLGRSQLKSSPASKGRGRSRGDRRSTHERGARRRAPLPSMCLFVSFRQWRGLRPDAAILIPVALVAAAAVAIVAAGGIRHATAAIPTPTPAGERITDDVLLASALALPVALAVAAAILTGLRPSSSRSRHAASQQAADACGHGRQQAPSTGARDTQLCERIERLVVHVGLLLWWPSPPDRHPSPRISAATDRHRGAVAGVESGSGIVSIAPPARVSTQRGEVLGESEARPS
jgi:hypothetical protein